MWQRQGLDGPHQFLGHAVRPIKTDRQRKKDELLTTITHHQIGGTADGDSQNLCDLLQTTIANQITIMIIINLEPIDIQHGQSQQLTDTLDALPFLVQHLVEVATIGNAGQGIGQAENFQTTIEYLQLYSAHDDALLKLALGTLQNIHQLLLNLQQPNLNLQFFLT